MDRKEYHKQYYQKNKTRLREGNKIWTRNNPIATKSSKIKHKYGITLEEYQAQFDRQEGRCGICRVALELGINAHFDHCHQTMKNREFLCKFCNGGLGFFRDNVSVLQEAINYINKYKGK